VNARDSFDERYPMDWKSATIKSGDDVSIPKRWLHLHYYEALNILFRMENTLRVFVYVVLKNKFREKWTETALHTAEDEQSTIAATAAKRMAQAKGFGYLGYEISSPLMYLNSGELTRIIVSDSFWELFKPYFLGKKEIIRTKLDEIGTVRNALAHFRPLKYDDIELIKQNVKHAFGGIEKCLSEMTQTYRVVPTNTETDWYAALSTIGSDRCKIALHQDSSEQWIRIEINYRPAILEHQAGSTFQSVQVTNLISPAIIKHFPIILSRCTFATELSYAILSGDTPDVGKRTSIVFSKPAILEDHAEIARQLVEALKKIDTETELVQKDNLARGVLVDSARLWGTLQGEENNRWWRSNTEGMKCEFKEDDPTEYWGEIGLYISDFIAGSNKYPWMPSDISKLDGPFDF
jgi:hypothetical protein